MSDLGTAWVTVALSTKGAERDLKQMFRGADAAGAGRKAGKEFSDAAGSATNLTAVEQKLAAVGKKGAGLLGTALKGGMATAAAGIAGVMGSALTLGFSRLTAIDDAKGKLTGLGHTAESTAKIMDSALAAVKGTAYGLGDAATIAASAVAAGVKPGQQLTEYLKVTADAASIAGTSLSDMGTIINQVRTGQTAYTDDLNQLAGRGLPIYQWIASEMGVAAESVKKLASDGKISAEIFEKAIRNNIGGAALKSGQTVRGAFENLKAALSRSGAAVLEGGFSRLPGFLTSLTGSIDAITPKITEFAKAFNARVFDEWLPKAKAVFDQLKGSGELASVGSVFSSLGSAVRDIVPSLLKIGQSLGVASAAIGVSGWKIFLTTLEAAAGVLKAVAPLLETIANLMVKNQGAVTALVAAWVGFRTIPSLLAKVSGAFLPLSSAIGGIGPRLREMRGGVVTAADSWKTLTGYIKQGNPGMSTAAANFTALKNGASGLASGGIGVVKGAVGGLVGALGGPLNIALMGATVLFANIAQKNGEAAAAMEGYRQAAKVTADAQIALNDALLASNGLMDEAAKAAAGARVQSAVGELDAASKSDASWLDQFRDSEGSLLGGFTSQIFDFSGASEQNNLGYAKDVRAETAKAAKDAIDGLKLSEQALSDQVSGSQPIFDALVGSLEKQGDGGFVAAERLKQAREAILGAQQASATASPVLAKLGEDVVKSAADIKTAFSALPTNVPIRVDAPGGEAVFDLLTRLGVQVREDNDKTIRVDAPMAPEVIRTLEALGFQVTTNNDKTITVKQVGAEDAGEQIDQAARDRIAKIQVAVDTAAAGVMAGAAIGAGVDIPQRRDGAIVPMAFGGLRQISKPQTAGIYQGRGAGTIFAEQETGGEAYIPLSPSKRGRSMQILAEVARLFGINRMADGGMTVEELKSFASRIQGRGYRWGGGSGNTFDTDCSGAQSTLANAITGASGRFSTATAAGELAARGFQTGDPPSGVSAYWVGWVNGGPGGGHMAATIVDPQGGNVNVEMGGRSGNGQFGGSAAGANGFPNRAWIALAGGDDPNNTSSAVMSASSSVTSARASVTSAQARLDQAQAEVDKLTAEGATAEKQAVAETKRDAAQTALDAAMEKQTAAETRLSEVKEKEAAKAETQTQKSAGMDGQGLGQSIVSGMLQTFGLDGSLFSNPMEWPNVKSVMAGLNFGGNLLNTAMGGQGGGPSLNGLDGFIKPIPNGATQPIADAPHAGSGAAPGVVVNGNIGMDPRQFTQRIDAHQNQAWRRNMSAVRPG